MAGRPRGHYVPKTRTGYYGSRAFTGRRTAYVGRTKSYAGARAAPRAQSFAPTSRASAMTPETKYFDTGINIAVGVTGADWTGTEIPCDNYVNSSGSAAAYTDSALIPSANGSAYGQVVGNRYKLKKIRVRGRIFPGTAVDQADVSVGAVSRLMLVMDTQPNGAQAQGEDVMQDIGAAGETIFSYKRVADTSGRFRILKDIFMDLNVSAVGTDGTNTNSVGFLAQSFSFQYQPQVPIQVNIKSGNATPTIGGLSSCNIFLLLNSQVGATIVAASRAYYCD